MPITVMSNLGAAGSGGRPSNAAGAAVPETASERRYLLERVGDAAVVQLYADGFRDLPLAEKTLIWHLYQAALAGRDIFYDQKHARCLEMRDLLEAIITAPGIEPRTYAEILRYTKLFWINSGPYNNKSARKFVLACTAEAFAAAAHTAAKAGARFATADGETLDQLLARLNPMFFDPAVDPLVTAKTPERGIDILSASANNLYEDVSMEDLAGFREEFPLNSRLVKRDGLVIEEVYRADGRYGRQISAVIRHLEAAIPFATDPMAEALRAQVRYYQTGRDSDREAYDIAWVEDKSSPVDTINGFVEVYLDARGIKGAWEGIVFYVNRDKTEGMQKLAAAAPWFEERMPWDPRYRNQGVRGITANAIDVVVETGDAGPVTAIGINLPNDQHVREQYGSKSVSLANVRDATDKSLLPEFRTEFSWSAEEASRSERWSAVGGELTTNMHEVIGHGSGKVEERLKGSPQTVLKEQYSALEEARAELVALYFLPDRKLVELGLVDGDGQAELVRTEYEGYARNALVQLRRVREGCQLEEDHMRAIQLIVGWLIGHANAIDVRTRDAKTYYVMTDPEAFHEGVGRLLREVQRIKSEGDYPAARSLLETYGVHFDPKLRDEVVARVDRLNLPSYSAFVMPKLEAVVDEAGQISDVAISYPQDLAVQMLEYSAATRDLRR